MSDPAADPGVLVDRVMVADCATGWDDQHLAQLGVRDRLAGADLSGFTARVRPYADDFTTTWCALVRDLGQDCERQADGLRRTALELLRTDDDIVGLPWGEVGLLEWR